MNTNKISYNKYVAEIIGTLMLVLVIALSGQMGLVFAAITLAFGVYLFSDVSGAHFNPAFTIAALTMKKIRWQDAILYICAQLIGAGIALMIIKNIPDIQFNQVLTSPGFNPWILLMSEVVGTIIYAFAFSAMIHGKTTKSNVGIVVGFGLFIGLLFANITGAGLVGLLNPAVAVGTNVLHWVTIIGPILGAIIGAWIYRYTVYGKFCDCDSDSGCDCKMFGRKNRSESSNSNETPVTETIVEVIEVSEPTI